MRNSTPQHGAMYPWAGTYRERLGYYLREDVRRNEAAFDGIVIFTNSIGGNVWKTNVLFTVEGEKPFFLRDDLSRPTYRTATDIVDEISWEHGDVDVAMVTTYLVDSDEIKTSIYIGDDAKHYQVGPGNIFDVTEEVRPI